MLDLLLAEDGHSVRSQTFFVKRVNPHSEMGKQDHWIYEHAVDVEIEEPKDSMTK